MAPLQFINSDGLHLAKDGDKVDLTGFDAGLGKVIAFLIDEDGGAVNFVHPFQAGGGVHGIADHREGFGGVGTDRADDGISGGQGHADVELGHVAAKTGDLGDFPPDLGKRIPQIEAGVAAVQGMGFTLGERAGPKGHDGIADKLVDDAVVGADAFGGGGKVAVEQADEVAGGELFPDAAKVGDVGKENRDAAALRHFLELTAGGIDHVGNDPGVQKLAEGLAELLLGFELFDHLVERGGEVADFVLGGDGERIGKLSLGGLTKGRGKTAERGLQPTGDDEENQQAENAGDGKKSQVGPNHMLDILVGFLQRGRHEFTGLGADLGVDRVQIFIPEHFFESLFGFGIFTLQGQIDGRDGNLHILLGAYFQGADRPN